jgi:hypothetical protein
MPNKALQLTPSRLASTLFGYGGLSFPFTFSLGYNPRSGQLSLAFDYKFMIRAVVAVLVLSTIPLLAQEITHTSTSGFVYNEKGRFPFSVEANLVPFDKSIHKQRYWGRDGGIPSFVCSAFSITLNGQPIEIPKKAFSDLGEITSVSAPSDHENDTWIVTVSGGDAGGSYEVELIFNDKKLLERRFIDLFSPGKERKAFKIQKY